MNKDENTQVINGCEYITQINRCIIKNRTSLFVFTTEEVIVGYVEIDHNLETVVVQYKISNTDYETGSYDYYQLPKEDLYLELASWIVNTHPSS